jgi:hypothetical protein
LRILTFALALPGVLLPAYAQAPVSVLVPGTVRHDHYLFNSSFTYDSQDYTGLPWDFYYVNIGSSPPPATLRTRCLLQQVNGAPYHHANFGWFRFPAPDGPWVWPPANGTEPFAPTGEYLETAQFGPVNGASPVGFVFDGEFAGEANPPSSQIQDNFTHFFEEAIYFTDRECSDAGTEYGWYRNVASSASGDMPPNSLTFYYAIFNNCNIDYGCWDVLGHQVQTQSATATITNLAPNSGGTYEYKYQVLRSGSDFNLSVLDPASDNPVNCQWSISTGGGASGACQFPVSIASWFPAPDQIPSGYIVVATQSSHLYPALTGAAYPQWYDYGSQGPGGAPPTNIVPTTEPNGTQSCLFQGTGFACLKAISLQILYE